MRAADVLGPSGLLARAMPGYEQRDAQLAMAELVENTLREERVALVEAGTGTGKTLAYLVPAVLSGKRVVVSTGTKTLQDQIMQNDLPLLEELTGLSFQSAVMKGLANYLCLRRYEEFVHSAAADLPTHRPYLDTLRQFRGETTSGERAELKLPETATIWSEVESGSDTRIGARCPYFESCFVTRMRRSAEQAQIIVVNHHLFFADLALRGPHGAAVIPDYDAVIFDEAHQIEDVVTEFFGVRISTTRVESLVRDVERAARGQRQRAETEALCRAVLQVGSVLFASLPAANDGLPGRRPLPHDALPKEARAGLVAFSDTLLALYQQQRANAHESEAIAQAARRIHRMREAVELVLDVNHSHVLWLEARGKRLALGASPVEVGDILRERLYEERKAVVMTSATLTTGRSFAFSKKRLGVTWEADELMLQSPFDYAEKAALYLPNHLPLPSDPEYVEAASQEIVALSALTGGGAFVLCTSLRMMQLLYERCFPHLKTLTLVQGMAPKSELLQKFKARGDAVLFASASFWEGIDVPGDALRLVVIDKLPFDVPTDPLIASRCARMEARGERAFMEYLVPSAALALKQGFGRLIRTAQDRGIVAILDPRLTQKGYGRVILRSLPDASRCHTHAELHAFWQGTAR